MSNHHNSKLTGNSQRLRREMTNEERHLWYVCLKALPVTINRQKIIGNYIVDFYCASAKLVIEIDGSQHYGTKGIELDNRRDEYLRSLGLTVKRYSNIDINQRFEIVSQEIYQFIFGKGEQGF